MSDAVNALVKGFLSQQWFWIIIIFGIISYIIVKKRENKR